MTTLFDHVPHATLPQAALPPSKAQDLLEELRFSTQRQEAMKAQLAAEESHYSQTKDKLAHEMRVGDYLDAPGISATRVRGSVIVHMERS